MEIDKIAAASSDATVTEAIKPEDVRPVIPDRVLQLDADITCYDCAYTDEPLSANIEQLKKLIENRRLASGSEFVATHVTLGKKAGREEVAMVQQYQENRSKRDPEQQERVRALREFLANYDTPAVQPAPWLDREADDGMAQAQQRAIDAGHEDLSVICTVDKDLDMVPGLHMHPKTYEMVTHPKGLGKLWLDKSGSTTKLKGDGKVFFFAQLLMGDRADHIPGIPKLPGVMVDKYQPLKSKSKKPRPAKLCGAVLAYEVLKNVKTEMQAFHVVRQAYNLFYGNPYQFTSWRGDVVEANGGMMLVEQARLLWMQRYTGEDVLDYFTEINMGITK